jgi:Flp pilus assembly protein TadG
VHPVKSSLQHERGSALLLIPVMVLVLFLAAGLVVDSAIGFSTKRDLVEAASAVANDTVSAIAEEPAYDSGDISLDKEFVERRAKQAIDARHSNWDSDIVAVARIVTGPDGRPAVQVTATGTAHYLFAQVFPWQPSTLQLSVTITSSLRDST